MANFKVNVLLDSGASATITIDALSIAAADEKLRTQMKETDPDFRVHVGKSLISLKKDRVLGWTIEGP